jgi:hypothetical protein
MLLLEMLLIVPEALVCSHTHLLSQFHLICFFFPLFSFNFRFADVSRVFLS